MIFITKTKLLRYIIITIYRIGNIIIVLKVAIIIVIIVTIIIVIVKVKVLVYYNNECKNSQCL